MPRGVRAGPDAEPYRPHLSVYSGRVLRLLAIVFLALDGIVKVVNPAPVLDAFAKRSLPASTATGIGVLVLVCTAIYAISRTAPLGAVLLTGFLGGAVAIHVRAEHAAFSVLFPLVIGAMVWIGLAMRDGRVRAVWTPRDAAPQLSSSSAAVATLARSTVVKHGTPATKAARRRGPSSGDAATTAAQFFVAAAGSSVTV